VFLSSAGGLSRLLSVPGIGPKTAMALARHFPTWDALSAASTTEIEQVAGKRAASADLAAGRALPEEVLVDAITIFEEGFPPALRSLSDPPVLLWVVGSLASAVELAGAVVGTRQPTHWGRRVAAAAAEAIGEGGASVVSGLALGIDGEAHRAALASGHHTVAVLGSGVDAPSPREHRHLAEAILEAGGALVSEMPPGTAPSARTLVARNRLQSGLSRLTVIAQCGIPSGTLHTARFTLLQRRRLIVPVPRGAHVDDSASAGNLALAASKPDPSVVRASKADAAWLARRPRLADDTPETGDALRAAIRSALLQDEPTREPEQGTLL
jgi:DNA processing protein